MYAVVVFDEHDEVELVPSNWLMSNIKMYWPPFRTLSAITKAIKDRVAPERETWAPYKIRVLAVADSYEDGRRKLLQAEYTSDIQTDAEETEMGRGARKRRPPVMTSSDEETEELPRPQRARVQTPPLPVLPEIVSGQGTSRSAAVISASNHTQTDELAIDQLQSLRGLSAKDMARPAYFAVGMGRQVCMAIVKAVSGMEVALEGVLKELGSQRNMLNRLWQHITSGTPNVHTADVDFTLPIKTLPELEQLAEKSTRDNLINKLGLIGGSSVGETVRRVMCQLLNQNVALEHNWAGRGSWKVDATPKRAFRELKLCSIVTKAVLRNPSLTTTQAEVETAIKLWLRNTADRQGGRMRRRLRKEAASASTSPDDHEQPASGNE